MLAFGDSIKEFWKRRSTLLVALGFVPLVAPALVFSYLPMTDYPQHLAIVSILRNFDEPSFGFAQWYEIDLGRTLYLLPYGIAWLASYVFSLDFAMHVVVFLSVLAYPLGLLCLLRALGRPPELAWLAAPFVYNRTFYWGFINFNMAIGLAFGAIGLFLLARDERWRPRTIIGFSVCISATVVTHVYGLALFLGVIGLYAVFGGFKEVWRRAPLLTVPVIGAIGWFVLTQRVEGWGVPIDPPFLPRMLELADSICGGFIDASDNALMIVGLLVMLGMLLSGGGVERMAPMNIAIGLTCVINLVLYFTLPRATTSAWFIHFRHAFLAVALLPAMLPQRALSRAQRALPTLLALIVIGNTWLHLMRFDREAHQFDEVIARAPVGAKVIGMNLTPWSAVVKTEAYLHFVAYVQAHKGGYVAMSFPQMFWNLPVKLKEGARIPWTPPGFEWNANSWDEREFGWFFDWALVRAEKQKIPRSEGFPFERVFKLPPWQLYKRVAP